MRKSEKHILDRVLAAILTVLMVFSVIQVGVFAQDGANGTNVVIENLPTRFIKGEYKEFTITVNTDNTDISKKVTGEIIIKSSGSKSDKGKNLADLVDDIQYKVNDKYVSINLKKFKYDGVKNTAEFPLVKMTYEFRVKFKYSGRFDAKFNFHSTVDENEKYGEGEHSFRVVGTPCKIESTTINDQNYNVGIATQFTVNLTHNGDQGSDVKVKKIVEASDESAKIEYIKGSKDEDAQKKVLSGKSSTDTFKITFSEQGKHTITVRYEENGEKICSAVATVNVENTYQVKLNECNDGGTVKLNDTELNKGESYTVKADDKHWLVVTPNEGYQIGNITINTNDVELKNNTEFKQEVTQDTEISVSFVKVYIVDVNIIKGDGKVDVNGTGVTTVGTITAKANDDGKLILKATPSEGYTVSQVIIDDADMKANLEKKPNQDFSSELTLKDHSVKVTFAQNQYSFKTEITGKGSVEAKDVTHGEDATVTLKPNAGCIVKSVSYKIGENDGGEVTVELDKNGNPYFIIKDVTDTPTVKVEFGEISKALLEDVYVDVSEKALRKEEKKLYVIQSGGTVTFGTEKNGIKLLCKDGNVIGDGSTKSVSVSETTDIKEIQLYYK